MRIISTNLSKVTTYVIKTFKNVAWIVRMRRILQQNPATDVNNLQTLQNIKFPYRYKKWLV